MPIYYSDRILLIFTAELGKIKVEITDCVLENQYLAKLNDAQRKMVEKLTQVLSTTFFHTLPVRSRIACKFPCNSLYDLSDFKLHRNTVIEKCQKGAIIGQAFSE